MPDLGKYAADVLAAYGVSLTLLAAIIYLSWRRANKTRKALDEIENG
jgi:heme exporter protein D